MFKVQTLPMLLHEPLLLCHVLKASKNFLILCLKVMRVFSKRQQKFVDDEVVRTCFSNLIPILRNIGSSLGPILHVAECYDFYKVNKFETLNVSNLLFFVLCRVALTATFYTREFFNLELKNSVGRERLLLSHSKDKWERTDTVYWHRCTLMNNYLQNSKSTNCTVFYRVKMATVLK